MQMHVFQLGLVSQPSWLWVGRTCEATDVDVNVQVVMGWLVGRVEAADEMQPTRPPLGPKVVKAGALTSSS